MRVLLQMLSRLTVVSALLMQLPVGTGGDWPGWRGVLRDDVSTETGLLTEWPEGGPKKLWTSTEMGLGYSSFAVVGDTLLTLGADQDEERLLAVDTSTGRIRWATPVGRQLKNKWGDGPRSTPTVIDDRVVALGARGDLICASLSDGAVLWSQSLKDYGGHIPNWGYSESPLVDEGRVIVSPGHEEGTVAAFDLETGDLLWQTSDVTQPAHYSSIIAAVHNGQRQYIKLGPESLFGIRAADGTVLWEVPWPGRIAVIPTPLYHDGLVYAAAGYGVGSMLVEVGDNDAQIRYHNKVMKNHHGGVIRLGDYVYGYSDGPGWVCQNFRTGEMVWNEKRALGKGAVSCADGLLYCLEQDTGVCALVRATPDGWEERGRLTLEPQSEQRSPSGRIWSHPVIAHGRLYLRDQEILCCYDISAKP